MVRNAAYEKCLLDQSAYWRDRAAQTRHQIDILRSELNNAQNDLRSFEQTKILLDEIIAGWNREKDEAAEEVRKIANASTKSSR